MSCFRYLRKLGEVQLSFCGDAICTSSNGIGTGVWKIVGLAIEISLSDSWKAYQLKYFGPQGCNAIMAILTKT